MGFDADQIRRDVSLPELVERRTGAKLRKNGRELEACCPFHSEDTPSFTVFPSTKRPGHRFQCFGCGVGGDVIDFIQEWDGVDFKEACEILGGKRQAPQEARRAAPPPAEAPDPYTDYRVLFPPQDAPELRAGQRTPPLLNPKRVDMRTGGPASVSYKPSMVFPYRDRRGRLVGYVLRVEFDDRKITPAILWMENDKTGFRGWCHGSMPEPRPLYGLDRFAAAPEAAPIALGEGEKTADALARLMPSMAAMSWLGGSKAYAKSKWDTLAGRRVVLFPDNDEPGENAMLGFWSTGAAPEWTPGIAEILLGHGCTVDYIARDLDKPDGWDAADAERDGWGTAELLAWGKPRMQRITGAELEARKKGAKPKPTSREKPPTKETKTAATRSTTQAKPKPQEERAPEPEREQHENVVAMKPGQPISRWSGENEDWRARLQFSYDKDGQKTDRLKPKSFLNYRLIITHHPRFKGLFGWNDFAELIYVMDAPPWGETKRGATYPRMLTDEDALRMREELEPLGLTPSRDDTLSAIHAAAKLNRFNQLRDYLNDLKWDGVPRLGGGVSPGGDILPCWLAAYAGAADSYVNQTFSTRFMIAAVARALRPGCKVDTMLVLEGKQGAMKSTALRVLATVNGTSYFTDGVTEITSKDTIMAMRGIWIAEVPELSAMSKADRDAIKAWLSRPIDRIRVPYGRAIEDFPRSCVLSGTINPTGQGWLQDPTGARRFWPVKVGGHVNVDALERDRDLLWAEAVHRFKAGEQWWLTEEEDAAADKVRRSRQREDPWADLIDDFTAQHPSGFTMQQVMASLVEKDKQSPLVQHRIADHLHSRGFNRVRAPRSLFNGRRPWIYSRDILPTEEDDEEEDDYGQEAVIS